MSVDNILSQDEVDALLSAVDRGEIPDAAGGGASPGAVVRYNFRKPNRVSKDQVKMLHSMHETFARLYTATLSTLLRGLVEIELKAVEQVTYGEFIMALSPPNCLVVFNMEPLKGGAALEVNASILFRFIDRLLGGSGLLPVRLRDFTEVERVLIERIAVRAMMDLQQAWQHAGTFGFRVAHVETNPQFVQLTSPNEVVIAITFDVAVGEERGNMTLIFPHLLLEPVMQKLNTHRNFATMQRELSAEENQGLQDNLLRVGLTVRGVLAEVPITIRELMALQPGAVLPLGKPATAPAVVEVEGVPRFTARPGTLNRKRALRVTAVVPKGEVMTDSDDRSMQARADVA
ncbi:MAG: flagellar motor switch protein FliM [Candidatus Rokubacteria bacterium]|nr:flagellar motor switch protein FliM [Candidatus Rokubacteria bacterium]